ncbi:MAG: hypothetical protein ACK4TG_10250 [Thermaurantiacus sp.]
MTGKAPAGSAEAAGAERRLTLDMRLPSPTAPGEKVSVHVVVEDVGEADARAPQLYAAELTDIEIGADGVFGIELAIPASADVEQAMAPAIRVHVDRGQTGTLTEGDFINPAIVPLPDATDAHCDVPLVEVG